MHNPDSFFPFTKPYNTSLLQASQYFINNSRVFQVVVVEGAVGPVLTQDMPLVMSLPRGNCYGT